MRLSSKRPRMGLSYSSRERRPLKAIATLLLGLLVAACAPQTQIRSVARGEATLESDAAIMADGTRLPVRIWAARNPKAVMLAVHGFNAYRGDFDLAGPWFADHGITVITYDQRGFGETDQRGIWAGSDLMVDDLRTIASLVQQKYAPLPLYVLGFSMGGAETMVALSEGMKPEGVILVAPAIWGWQAMNPLYKAALWIAAHTVPSRTASGRGLEIYPTDNIDVLRTLSKDPLYIRGTRFDSLYGLVTLMDEAYDAAGSLGDVPILYLYGAHDQLVPKHPTATVISRIGGRARVAYYPEGWHMLLHDKQWETVYRDIAAWISNPRGRLPSDSEIEPQQAAERIR